MTRLEAAAQRLEKAIERLERAAAGRVSVAADNRRLAAELETVRADYMALEQVATTVETRLDVAIDRINKTLES
jgi:uncharacterized protein (UPF0335 family)